MFSDTLFIAIFDTQEGSIENDAPEESQEVEEGRPASGDPEHSEHSELAAQSPIDRSEKNSDEVTIIMATHLGMDKYEIGESAKPIEAVKTL